MQKKYVLGFTAVLLLTSATSATAAQQMQTWQGFSVGDRFAVPYDLGNGFHGLAVGVYQCPIYGIGDIVPTDGPCPLIGNQDSTSSYIPQGKILEMQYDTTGPVGVEAVHMWWRVTFDTGPSGWVIAGTTKPRFVKPEDIPQPEPEPAPFTQGQCVKAVITRSSANFFVFSDSNINDNALLGSQRAGALGTIQGGPVEQARKGTITQNGRTYIGNVGFDLYYNVDFKNSPDGWIKGRRQDLNKRTFEQSLVASSECGGGDTTKPTISITSPTSAATYPTTATPLTISGTANDNTRLAQVTWSNNRGGGGAANGTTNWNASVALSTGENVITTTATDVAGNQATNTLTVTNNSGANVGGDGGSGDLAIRIVIPTGADTYSYESYNNAPLQLTGSMSGTGITEVVWSTDRGQSGAGTMGIARTGWGAQATLSSGSNVVTITVKDSAGHQASDSITVTYAPTQPAQPFLLDCGPPDHIKVPWPAPCPQPVPDYTAFPMVYPYDPTQVRGRNQPTYRIEVVDPVGAKVYTERELKKATEHNTYPNSPDGIPHKTQPKGTKGTILKGDGVARNIRSVYIDFDPPGFDAVSDGYVFPEYVESLYGPISLPLRDLTSSAYNAELTLVDPPATMQPGERRVVNVRVKNTGTATLVAGSGYGSNYNLIVDPSVSTEVDWKEYQFPYKTGALTHDLAPNQEATIPFTITAPITGKYALRLRLKGGTYGAPLTYGFVGQASNEAVITVGDPANANLSCPAGYRVIDVNQLGMYKNVRFHHYINLTVNAGWSEKFCMSWDVAVHDGELIVFVFNGAEDPQGGNWKVKVTPPAGSGLQIGPTDEEGNEEVYGVRSSNNQPVIGNYLFEVESLRDQGAWIAIGTGKGTDSRVIELDDRSQIQGKTFDLQGNGTPAKVFLSPPHTRVYANFPTRQSTDFEYKFPNVSGFADTSVQGGGEPYQYKVSASKPGYTSEYRINNGAWVPGSWTYVDLASGGLTVNVDWRFTATAQVLPVGNGSRVRVKQSSAVTGVNVRQKPQIPSVIFGTQPNGALGKVLADPVATDSLGRKWWKVDFDVRGGVNIDGWVIGSRLQVDPSVAPTPSPTEVTPPTSIGDRVEVVYAELAEVYRDSPIGVQNPTRVGSQPRGTKGTVVDGPSRGYADGRIFWKVNFDGSTFDGWVHQAYLKKITGALPSDTTAPEITFAFPAADGQTVTANTAVFSATITDAGTGVASAWWLLTKSGTSQHYKGSVSKTNYGWIAEEPDGSGYQIPLYEGSNIVEFAARDNAGNVGTSTITVIRNSGGGTLDTTAPAVNFLVPTTNNGTNNTSQPRSTVGLDIKDNTGGVGIDNATVRWTRAAGNIIVAHGKVDKTSYGWFASENSALSIALTQGSNIIEVGAKDNSGNAATSTITVVYTPGSSLGNTNSNLAETLQGLKDSLQNVKDLLKLYQGQ